MRRVLAIAVAVLALRATAAAAAGPLRLAVAADGRLSLRMGDRLVASGRWDLRPDSYVPPEGPDPFNPGPVVAAAATQDTPTHAVVHERFAAARCDFDFELAGEDLRVAAHVVNADPARALRPVAFTGLTFHFNPAAPATGQLQDWYWTYLAAQGLAVLHPSTASPVGCWWAADDRFGFAAFSESEFDRPALVSAKWDTRDYFIAPECQPEFFTARSVPPGSAADVTLTFRVSADRSMAHLIGGYKAVYDRRFPLPLYTPDDRMVGRFTEVDAKHVTPANPLGYHADWCRFDTPLGTAAYVRRFAPTMRRDGYAGMIFWSPGGYDPPMYPPDFDVLPKSVLANVPALVDGFHAHGLRVGLCARPGDGVDRSHPSAPTVFRLSADDPEQMRAGMDRFRHAMAMGFDMFYLDSIGGSGVNDVRIIRRVRDTVGPGVLLYSENCTDMSLPYAGRYCEWQAGGGLLWDGRVSYDALRLLRPDATWLCVSRAADPIPAPFDDWKLTPLLEDQLIARARPWSPRH